MNPVHNICKSEEQLLFFRALFNMLMEVGISIQKNKHISKQLMFILLNISFYY